MQRFGTCDPSRKYPILREALHRLDAHGSFSSHLVREGGESLNPCWVLIVTRGLRVWLPPEVYLNRALAIREADRWRAILHIRATASPCTRRTRHLNLVETEFPDSWRACPVWVGVTWNVKTYPHKRSELMAADEEEAAQWLRRRTPKGSPARAGAQTEFDRRGVLTNVGGFRVKRVMWF